ncbi:hypothetical protein LSH36_291g03048 [Paralvinella palmiformis]|uniref:SOCS box domain-containing protein n=1 Tax=Paralvinella palmiformis TaxID=53620 RepID=A0AAD9N311_9ANNE|nr:hypothetical protein LSH36_291g03048 [Paralvinella palmiformis]
MSELSELILTIPHEEINQLMMRTIMLTDRKEHLDILLRAGANINYQDREGRTALFLAVKYSRLGMIELLIERKCDVNLGKFNQSNALHLAAKKGDSEIIEMLVAAGHNLDALNWGGNTPLLIACRFGHATSVMKLISHSANVNICNKLGHYPLHYAAFAGDADLVQILMDRGANSDVRTHLGINPIMLACERKHCSVVSTLASQCNLHYREQLYGGTVLHWAIASGCCHCVDCLLTHGASLNIADSTGRTPILEAVQSKQPEILRFLLDRHHFEDFVTQPNSCLLHLAAFLGFVECVEIICKHKCTKHLIASTDSFGESALDLVLKCSWRDTTQMLIKHGASIDHIVVRLPGSLQSSQNRSHHSEGNQNHEGPINPESLDETTSPKQYIQVENADLLKLTDLCLEAAHELQLKTKHKVFKTYSAVKMGMIDMLRSASSQQMVAPVKFDFNTWLDNGPEAFVLKVTSLDLTNWIHQRMHTPWALRELCRGCIRRMLGYRASDKVELLPVPTTVKDFLNMKELEDIETSAIKIRSSGAFDDIDIE